MGTCVLPSAAEVTNWLSTRPRKHVILSRFPVYESRKNLTDFIGHQYFSALTVLRCAGLKTNDTLRNVHLIDLHRQQLQTRQPYVRAHSASERNQRSGQYSISLRYCPSSKNPLRMLFSASLGNLGARTTFGGLACCPSRNMRLSAANSLLQSDQARVGLLEALFALGDRGVLLNLLGLVVSMALLGWQRFWTLTSMASPISSCKCRKAMAACFILLQDEATDRLLKSQPEHAGADSASWRATSITTASPIWP